MSLTVKEVKELEGLHDVITRVECFGSRDVLRQSQLLRKASITQLRKICSRWYMQAGVQNEITSQINKGEIKP